MSYLDNQINERLNGDRSRVSELFTGDSFLVELIKNEKPGDWFRFSEATYDGEYLIKYGATYLCYQQDRGVKFGERRFSNLDEAVASMFRVTPNHN